MLYSEMYQDDCLLLHPFTDGTSYFTYAPPPVHRLTLENDPARAHEASYSNASRVTTFLRPGVEQFHGAIFGTYKVQCSVVEYTLPHSTVVCTHCLTVL
jgi:hypothetical protein